MTNPKRKPLPAHIKQYAFEFHWDNALLWKLDAPSEIMDVSELVWHFDVAWLHSRDGRFDVTPAEVMQYPDMHAKEYARTMQADLDYPIDIMFNKGRWLILDGLHRLMKSVAQGKTQVCVRKIMTEQIPLIEVE
jgi:hypothetical protein